MTTHFKTFLLVVGAGFGIVIGYQTAYASEIAIAGGLLAMVQMLVYGFSRKRESTNSALSIATALLSLGLVIGIVRVQLVEEKIAYVCQTSCSFEANIISSPQSKDTYQTLEVHPIEKGSEILNVQLRVPLYPRYQIGETIKVSGKVSVPKPIPPHGDAKSFDYAEYLATRNIGSEMLFPKVEVLDSDAHTLTEYLGRWKEILILRMNRFVASPASTLATGMLFGNSGMPKDLAQTFRVAGLSHIIVLSGFNIAIVIASILFIFAFIPLVLRITLASLFVILFVMMVGAEASVIRATAMAFIALLSTLVGRAYVARQALLLSLFAIAMYSPQSFLNDVSLHLSFLATAGIVYGSEPIKEILQKHLSNKIFIELATTTLVAYFATLPYVCYTFGTVSVYALVANMFALPFVPVAMLMSFLVVCASYVSASLAIVTGYTDSLILNVIIFVAQKIEGLPFSYGTLSVSFVGMCIMYTVFACAVWLGRKENETFVTDESGYLTGIIKY